MSRSKPSVASRARRKKLLAKSKGYRGRSSTNFRIAKERLEKALRYAYRDRRARKRNFRALWIQRARVDLFAVHQRPGQGRDRARSQGALRSCDPRARVV